MKGCEMENVLVTGANRGIGLEFVKQYLNKQYCVLANCRQPDLADELKALKKSYPDRLFVIQLDVADPDSISRCRKIAGEIIKKLDVLVNNAGCFAAGEEGLETVDPGKVLHVFRTNALGPLLMCQAFSDLLANAAYGKVISLTSGAGVLSTKEPEPGKQFSYGATKAALHKFIRQAAADLKELGVICVGMAPGYVLTDMTRNGGNPPLEPPESVFGMIETTDKLTLSDAGLFFAHSGKICDWLQ